MTDPTRFPPPARAFPLRRLPTSDAARPSRRVAPAHARALAAIAIGAIALSSLRPAAAADAPAAAAPGIASTQACTPQPGFGDIVTIQCTWTAGATPQKLRFKADFGGSHDDTIVSIDPKLDGKPLDCLPGSTLRREFEDGEVTVDCLFTPPPGTSHTLAVRVTWTHAQYLGFGFGPQP